MADTAPAAATRRPPLCPDCAGDFGRTAQVWVPEDGHGLTRSGRESAGWRDTILRNLREDLAKTSARCVERDHPNRW